MQELQQFLPRTTTEKRSICCCKLPVSLQTPTPGAVAELLMLFDRRLDGLAGESTVGLAQELEGKLIRPREAPPFDIRIGQGLYALQPCGKRRDLCQRLFRIIRDDTAFLRAPRLLKGIIVGEARQFRPWLRLLD